MQQLLLPEQGIAGLCALLCRYTGGRCGTTPRGAAFFSTPASAWYSRTLLTGIAPDAAADTLASILTQAADGAGAYPIFAAFTAEASDAALPGVLEGAGFVPMARQAGMVYPLEQYAPGRKAPDVVVEKIVAGEITAWSAAGAAAFHKPDEADAFCALERSGECIFYGVRADGALAATLLLHLDPENTGIHEVAVLPNHRGRGLARALTETALAEAAAHGAPLVSLQASEMGEQVYGRLGFIRVSTLETWIHTGQPGAGPP